jgi:hypothetical protein
LDDRIRSLAVRFTFVGTRVVCRFPSYSYGVPHVRYSTRR